MEYIGWKKYLVATWALVETFLFGGLLYGWAPVVYVFKQQQIYADLCPSNTTVPQTNIASNYTVNGVENVTSLSVPIKDDEMTSKPCGPQDEKFALAFTVGSAMFCVGSAASGFINFKFGTRMTRIISMIMFMSGTLMFAFVSVDIPWLVFTAQSCVGIGGLPLLMTNTQISNLFITGSSTFIGLLCGAFDCSSAVQLLVKIAYENGIHSSYSYFLLTGLHLLVAVSTFVFLPKTFIPSPKDKVGKEDDIATDEKSVELLQRTEEKQVYENTTLQNDDSTAAHVPSLKSCLVSPMFILHVFWLCILQLRFFYFLASLNTYLHRITDDDKARVSHFTNVMLYTMMGGLLSSMFAGIVYDWQRRMFQDSKSELKRRLLPSVLPLVIASGLGLLMSVLVLVPHPNILYVVFIAMTVYRSFLYSVATVFLTSIFPGEYFGILYGIMIIIGGIVGFLQFALFTWSQAYANGPDHANILCIVLITASFLHPALQWFKCRRERYKLA